MGDLATRPVREVTLLVASSELGTRRRIAQGALSPLAQGLRRELQPLIDGDHDVPAQSALLSRAGGRCARDGTLLAYDPFDVRHRCARCGREEVGVEHDRFRLYWHHLWLAERAVHAALLGTLLDDAACSALASDLLEAYANRYREYPNQDNVLGPSRPFFSTYLESIWLLQVMIALDLLEAGTPGDSMRALGGRVRERLIGPSAALIASFDEGSSNRQVWNNAALIAAGRLLGENGMAERAVVGPSGLHAHLHDALLEDGSWYEGENYHLFAHRGLWYGVQLSQQCGYVLPTPLGERFVEGFAAPFRTVLPDLTYPSRRDSQYAVSVRQPRFAESCELGLVAGDDARLLGWLARLYDPLVPRGETGRARSTADVERNLPPTSLTRADLSWRTLLLGREALPALVARTLGSELLPSQGYAVLRRDRGTVYAALDYGHSGGGHGHPDRLNVLLMDGDTRWFDDPGTGSYVDRSLHWYRSTLAHTAPLVDGRSQPRTHGTLVAFDDQPRASWVCADVGLAPGLQLRRSLVVLDDYLIDLLQWDGEHEHEVALPLHGVDLVDAGDRPLARTAATIEGGTDDEDGFSYLMNGARIAAEATPFAHALGSRSTTAGVAQLRGWIRCGAGTTWWSAHAPDAPGREGSAFMLLARHRAVRGGVLSVWTWRDALATVEMQGEEVVVHRRDGGRDTHVVVTDGWRIDGHRAGSRTSDLLKGFSARAHASLGAGTAPSQSPLPPAALPAAYRLGERHYRRSEESWHVAGEPHAEVSLSIAHGRTVSISVRVEPSHRLFVPPDTENSLDNEPAAINGDGVQLYLACGGASGAWILIPVADGDVVTTLPIAGWGSGLSVEATWRATESGYALDARVVLPAAGGVMSLDLIVNEIAPGRSRRRGQLVLSGAAGEFVYLRGDRHDPQRLLRFLVPDV